MESLRNFKSLLIVFVAMVLVVLFLGCRSVYATGEIVLNPGATSNSTNTTTNTTGNSTNATNTASATNNTSLNTVRNTTNTTTNTSNVLNTSTTNNINNGVNKDLPQTGENDTYIIAGIGSIAFVIGVIAFIKSRNV